MKTKSSNAKHFSHLDMIRWARYLTEGRIPDWSLQARFESWFDGPPDNWSGRREHTNWKQKARKK